MPSPDQPSRDECINAADVVNDLLNDLFSAVGLWRGLVNARSKSLVNFRQEVLDRVVNGHIIVALHKVGELLVHPTYSRIFGSHELEWRRSVRKKISSGGISGLRNAYIGHIHNQNLGRPMYASELDSLYKTVLGPKVDDFFKWVLEGDQSVFQLLLSLRNFLESTYSIKPEEVLNR